jgi:predicted amidohydrolase
LQVCYDLRFPVFARNNDDYDAVLYVANWPEKRVGAWEHLLKARAIENFLLFLD